MKHKMNKSTAGFIGLVAILAVSATFSLTLYQRQRVDHDLLDIKKFPYTVGGWKGRDQEITEREYEILETRNLFSREYENKAGEKVYLFIIYSETNRSVFHPPEVCLIGSGVTITDKQTEKIGDNRRNFNSNKLYCGKGNEKSISLYSYKAGNFYTDNYFLQQALFAVNQLFGKRKGGATIRVSMTVVKDEKTTTETLKKFMSDSIRLLEELEGKRT